ncbi:DUF2470 domain-containing protein [Streptomyces sp. RKND-216]|nr:DUF2470 domain-containing protein [Streptomyces sp. RKND-216]
MEDARGPSAAERVRTLVESSVSARLLVPGIESETGGLGLPDDVPVARAVDTDGDVLLLVGAAHPAARAAARARDDELCAVMEITDVAPVAVPHRVRGRAWVAGWLTPVAAADRPAAARLLAEHAMGGPVPDDGRLLLRLEVGEAHVDDLWGEDAVEPDAFAAATADPLARHEAELLQHLAAAHGDQVRGLCTLLDAFPAPHEAPGDASCAAVALGRVTPLALDRFGIRVRFGDGDGIACYDARFDFAEPVRDMGGLRRAMHGLFEAATTAR